MAATATTAAIFVPSAARPAVIWCGVVATVAVALVSAEAVRRGRALAALRAAATEREAMLRQQLNDQDAAWRSAGDERHDALVRQLQEQEAATVRLASEQLPEAVNRLQEGEFTEDVLQSLGVQGRGLTPEFEAAHRALLRSVVEAMQAEEGLRDSAQRGMVNIARRMQALVHKQATELTGMERAYGQEAQFVTDGQAAQIMGDLLKLDHGNALLGRLADSISVLGGARPGRQWSKPVALYSVLRGAMSRIDAYERVDLHSVAEVAVVGPAVEPLIHALAELLDNATRYSPPKTRVHLTAGEVHMGIAVEIEDGGIGLSEEARERVERMLREAHAGLDLDDLGEAPRLGISVVGRLAQANSFEVTLSRSAYGGVRAVLVVPSNLVTTAPATGRAHGIGAASVPRSEPEAAQVQESSNGRGPAIPAPRASADMPAHAAQVAHSPYSAGPAHSAGAADGGAGAPGTGAGAGPWGNGAEGNGAQGNVPTGPTGPVRPDDDEETASEERTPSGLPQRRRRRPARSAGAPPAPEAGTTPSEKPAPGAWMAAFQSGRSGETPPSAPARGNSDTSDKGE
ncbi:ATP-binding protein [Actinacidiphila sp. SB3-2]